MLWLRKPDSTHLPSNSTTPPFLTRPPTQGFGPSAYLGVPLGAEIYPRLLHGVGWLVRVYSRRARTW